MAVLVDVDGLRANRPVPRRRADGRGRRRATLIFAPSTTWTFRYLPDASTSCSVEKVTPAEHLTEGRGVGAGVGIGAGMGVGGTVGTEDGSVVGTPVGRAVGGTVGRPVGSDVGAPVGTAVGGTVGTGDGSVVGTLVGWDEGGVVGSAVGAEIGTADGYDVGIPVGTDVGTSAVGAGVGSAAQSFSYQLRWGFLFAAIVTSMSPSSSRSTASTQNMSPSWGVRPLMTFFSKVGVVAQSFNSQTIFVGPPAGPRFEPA